MSRIQIKLKTRDRFLERGVDVPGHIWQEPPFFFKPLDFAIGNERLREKIFTSDVQESSLERFQADPTRPVVYGVGSEPSDQRAKYFAVYLVQLFLEAAPLNCTVKWDSLTGGFDNPSLNLEPSLLVLSGLTPNSTQVKLEKARDLLEKHSNIPRIVVVSGEDPVTFFMTRLYYSLNNIFFHSSTLIKRRVEVV